MDCETVKEVEVMYCKKCGQRISKKDVVCESCGRPCNEREYEYKDEHGDEYKDEHEYRDEHDDDDEEYDDEHDDDDEEYEYEYLDGEDARRFHAGNQRSNIYRKPKKRMIALLLALFLGGLGAHRFYMGRYKSAIMIIILVFVLGVPTAGLSEIAAMIWVLADCVLILMRRLKTADGRDLV